MRAAIKITFFDDNDEKFFGEGPYRLLLAIEETGSLRSASKSMGLAYSKAFRMIKNAEEALGFSLTSRTTGGRSGGGSSYPGADPQRKSGRRDRCYRRKATGSAN